ncbi:MAG TPA: uroporphyrinogen-III C-methyltransferase [Bacteroidia bacterium]|jgi:uroporphyrin-III C-methyltransferase|nr:uroporphyrinogen-III C-methyltransferase [Bacteroidia bacterium]
MKTKIYPKLTLVGAGPGDIELITLKGVKALQEADVVLYDALVNPELLKFAPVNAHKIYVGKRSRNHTYTQEQINTLIVESAHTHGHVVRLKGGDSFVFGRGLEEIKYAELFDIETAVVPGISSSIGVPALSGIPVTHRGASESFWVITGTTTSGKLSKDVRVAAHTDATVIILMGVSKLAEIVEVYKNAGKDDTGIAIIQDGTLPTEKIAIGNIDTIRHIAIKKKIESPAVIVIGEVVKLHSRFPLRLSNLKHLLN